jgi:hypothetical protein
MPADSPASGLRAVPDVEAGIQALFELDPAGFVAARDDLAKRLRQAGAKEPATAVKALRRPTVAAWAVNLLARRERGLVEDLLEAGRALDEAQRQAISGKGAAAMRTAGSRRRTALSAAVKAAARLLEGEGGSPDAHLPGIRATLEAASADPDGAGADVLAGRLSAELAGPSGFGTEAEGGGDGGDMAMWTLPAEPAAPKEKRERRSRLKVAPEPERRRKAKPEPEEPEEPEETAAARARREELEKARARAEESEAKAAELERVADEAADAADEAAGEADAAGKRATELAKELDRAERAARQAERTARVAASEATRAATEARRARTAASRAARVLADLEDG